MARAKDIHQIKDFGDSGAVLKLRPVSFCFKDHQTPRIGIIAEEAEYLIPWVIDASTGDVSQEHLATLLLSEIKRMKAQIDLLQKQINEIRR